MADNFQMNTFSNFQIKIVLKSWIQQIQPKMSATNMPR